jgi:hypothetical protein
MPPRIVRVMARRTARAVAAVTVLVGATASGAAGPVDVPAPSASAAARGWFEVTLPRGAALLAEAAGLDPATEPWRLLPDLTRRLHAPYGEKTGPRVVPQVLALLRGSAPAAPASTSAPGQLEYRLATRMAVSPAPAGAVGGDEGTVLAVPGRPHPPSSDPVPIPLTPEAWRRILGDGDATAGDLVTAVATHPPAARLFRGLATLDPATLAALAGEADTLRRILRGHADAFSIFAPSFRIEDGRVAVPGGHAQSTLWQEVIGAPVMRPAEFLLRLASADAGRLFFFYDSIERLDEAHRRFALSAGERDPERRVERVRALKVLFSAADPWWDDGRPPFRRPPADAARVLDTARVTPEGGLAAPNREVLWEAAFADQVDAPAAWRARLAQSAAADAAWLVERIANVEYNLGRSRLGLFAFAQRVFGDGADAADAGDLLAALRGYGRYRALALTLERMGVRDVALHAAAARHAQRLEEGREHARVALAQFQGALALVERAVHASTLDADEGAGRVRSLLAVPLEDGRYGDGVARWIEADLLPVFRERLRLAPTAAAETVALHALAGYASGRAPLRRQWEGLPYDVDPAAAEYRRLVRTRERQGGPKLDDALAAPAAEREARLAGVLTDIVYATALGPAEGAPSASEDVARRHDFGFAEAEAPGGPRAGWALPREVAGPGQRWHARGALLGLDVAFARLALQRLESEVPPAPLLTAADRRAFAEGVVLLRASELDGAGRDAIADALRRGRLRLAQAAADPNALAGVLSELRVRDWRRSTLPWVVAHDPARLDRAFTLGEVVWLGRSTDGPPLDQGWGTSGRAADGCLCPRLGHPAPADTLAGRPTDGRFAALAPDLHLRAAELLAEMGLPARLAPAILALAVQDLVDEAEPAYLDDVLGIARFARGLTRTRMEDYVAALVGQGPLLPVAEP